MAKPSKTAFVMGSGGHTSEMIKLIKGTKYGPNDTRHYIIAETDKMSVKKVEEIEGDSKNFEIHLIKRSRNVGQSYFTSIFTTLLAIFYSFPLMIKIKPDLLIVNGPGTCIPIAFVTFLLSRIFHIIPKCKIVFVESICRVKTLSLSGKLLYHLRITDAFMVQWPELKEKFNKAVYLGRLV